ncbi:IS3 family transposase, partial [Escherichia coli]|nr:IS3 family transposase [Escherichia coli]
MFTSFSGSLVSRIPGAVHIAPKIGCTPETLRVWVRQHERDTGGGDGGLT